MKRLLRTFLARSVIAALILSTGGHDRLSGADTAGVDFSFGCARPLYEQKQHPRVMLGPAEMARLRERTRAGDGRRILSALHEKVIPDVRRFEEWTPDPGATSEANVKQLGRPLMDTLFDIAIAGVLDEDQRFIQAASRMLTLVPAADRFARTYDILWHHLTPEARRAYCEWAVANSVKARLEATRDVFFRGAGANLNIHNMYAPLATILSIQGDEGVPDLGPELRESLLRFEATMNVAINRDGYPEEDIGYGTQAAARMSFLVEATRRAGLFDAYRQCPRFAKFGRAILHFVQPWGQFLSNTGDHGDDFDSREFILARLATETGDPALLWLLGTLTYPPWVNDTHVGNRASHREIALSDELPNVPATAWSLLALDDLHGKSAHPAKLGIPTQFIDRGRGLVSLRSGWNDDDTLVLFDGSQRSPGAMGHAHDSGGHFTLSALGEYFAIGTGRFNIEQNGHNVVLVDGKSGRSTDGQWRMSRYHGVLTNYVPGDFTDFAAVDSSHQHDCFWAWRSIGLVKGSGAPGYAWTVENINRSNERCEYWWQLHTSPENTITLGEKSAVIRGWRHGNLLDVHFVMPEEKQYRRPHVLALAQDVATPSSFRYITEPGKSAAELAVRPSDQLHHAGYVRPRLLAKVTADTGRFMSLMLPRRKGEQPARVERIASVANSLAVRITFEKVEDILIFACEHDLLEAADIRARGQWCVVRRSLETGAILAHAIGHGVSLEVGGKVIQLPPEAPFTRATPPLR